MLLFIIISPPLGSLPSVDSTLIKDVIIYVIIEWDNHGNQFEVIICWDHDRDLQ